MTTWMALSSWGATAVTDCFAGAGAAGDPNSYHA
jgi:hypothetical protein